MMPVASTLLNDKSLNDHDMWLTACLPDGGNSTIVAWGDFWNHGMWVIQSAKFVLHNRHWAYIILMSSIYFLYIT